MPTCPQGHESRAIDFCDVCGIEMAPAAVVDTPAVPPVENAPGGEPCPTCGTPQGPGVFCEVCGYNFATGIQPVVVDAAPPKPQAPAVVTPEPTPVTTITPPPRWELRVSVDPAVPDAPTATPERIFPLLNAEIAVGRRSLKRQIVPDVPLDEDDGVSHRHVTLRQQPDGATWAVLDLGSSNGTRLNDAELPPNVLTPLKFGDTLRLGRWSVLTLHRL